MLGAVVGLATTTMLFPGCSKEESPSIRAKTDHSYDPSARVNSFIERARSSTYQKSAEHFSADSAVWYVEAALNYSLADIRFNYADKFVDSITVQLSMGPGGAAAADVYAGFAHLFEQLSALNDNEYQLIVVDVLEHGHENGTLTAVYQLGLGAPKGAPNATYTVHNDYTWGKIGDIQPHLLCRCGTNTNIPEYCANKIIQQRINAANYYALLPGQYVTDVETWTVNWTPTHLPSKTYNVWAPPLQGPAPLGDGYRDSKTFSWRSNSTLPAGGGTCVQDTEMSFWTGNATQGTWSAITTIQGLHCPTKLFLSSNLMSHVYGVSGQPDWYMHTCQFTYGRIVYQGSQG